MRTIELLSLHGADIVACEKRRRTNKVPLLLNSIKIQLLETSGVRFARRGDTWDVPALVPQCVSRVHRVS
jgi:hypothetical protein